jgi:hypothetical protein
VIYNEGVRIDIDGFNGHGIYGQVNGKANKKLLAWEIWKEQDRLFIEFYGIDNRLVYIGLRA